MKSFYAVRSLNAQNNKQRFGEVDLLRFVGIFLMIIGHVGFGEELDIWEGGFYMPIFFIVSGYFLKPAKTTSQYVRTRIKSLLLPYFMFGLFYEILWTLAGHNQWRGLIYPNSILVPLNGALWFLPALFIADIIVFLLFKYLSIVNATILIVLISILGSLSLFVLPLSADSALVGCGFIAIGYFLRNNGKSLLQQRAVLSLGGC